MAEDAAAIAGVIDRPRLYRILDAPAVRVCIVQGPSGSGKTTLLRSWAACAHSDARVVWVSLSPGVTSRYAFWQHAVASGRRLSRRPETLARIVEQLNAAADPVRVVAPLLSQTGPVTLVLDAYEHLGPAQADVDADIARLVRTVPDLRVLVTTRAGTALAEFDAGGEGVVRVVSLAELALTSDEVRLLIAARAGLDDVRLARSVTAATKGFPLTVCAVALALAQLGRIPQVDSMEWDAIVAARLESMLPDAVAAQFVADTAVAPYVDVELAERLSGQVEAEPLLQTLERNGFGRWVPYARRHPVFQYVETIRDTFRARAAQDPDRFRRLCADTARWLFEHDDIDQALQSAIDGGDYAFADRVYVSLVVGNPDCYITDRFLAPLRRVPAEALSAYPMLAFGLGLALATNTGLRLEAPRVFRIAITSPVNASYLDPEIDAFSLAAMRAISHRLAFEFPESTRACAEVVHSLDELSGDLVTRYGEHLGTILRQLGYSLLLGGRIEEAIAVSGRSAGMCTDPASRNYSIVYAAGASAFAGDLVRARSYCRSVDEDAWPPALKATYLNAFGVIADVFERLDALDFAGALDVLRDTDCCTPTTEFWPFLTALSVLSRHGLGQAGAEAERVTRELAGPRPPSIGDNIATDHLHAALARSWIVVGDIPAAARLLDELPPQREQLSAARVARLLAEGRDGDALAQTDAELGLGGHTIRTRADLWTVGAVAALRRGETDWAWSWLTAAALAWENYGPRLHVALLPARDRRMLSDFARERDPRALHGYLGVPAGARQAVGTPSVTLTPRERVVLAALDGPGSIRDVARSLVVSPHTVKTQLQGIYRKLGVSSRHAAVAVAVELGLLDGPGSGDDAQRY
ncbi:NACHT domain-containing protein [Microbacterium luticocti]|uniref:NACHT domain-containing protein n=1 Tax=Microbacterium luticocti TaxID=451764 RepID=UPI00146EB952|nr:NACHT domain-containing protein [Microbacterium luticocti]